MTDKGVEKQAYRLTINIEFADDDYTCFDLDNFRVLVDGALKQILGISTPLYTIVDFEKQSHRGSLEIRGIDHVHLIWAALSIYGVHFDRRVAIHLSSIAS